MIFIMKKQLILNQLLKLHSNYSATSEFLLWFPLWFLFNFYNMNFLKFILNNKLKIRASIAKIFNILNFLNTQITL